MRRTGQVRLLNRIHDRGAPIQANRTLALVRKLFKWAVAEGYLESSPAQGIPSRAKEQARTRTLTPAELVAFWRALDAFEPITADALRLQLLTGARVREITGMARAELARDGAMTAPRVVSRLAPWGLRWSSISKFMRLRISQFAATIPLIGYLLLWSEKAKGFFVLQGVLADGLWFDTTQRLKFVYYGAICLGIAWVIFQLRCPSIIKRHPAPEDHLSEQAMIRDGISSRRIRAIVETYLILAQGNWTYTPIVPATVIEVLTASELRGALNNPNDRRSTIFLAHYLREELRNPWGLVIAMIFAGVGLVCVLIPSLEVFLLVTSRFRLL